MATSASSISFPLQRPFMSDSHVPADGVAPAVAPPTRRSVAIAVTGASGAVYATRTMAALLERGCHLEVVVSEYGRRLLRDELGDAASIDKLTDYLATKYGGSVRNGTTTLYSNKDLGAK